MNTNYRFYSYRQNLPLSLLQFVLLLGMFAFTILAILGLFIGVIVGAVAAGFFLLRLLIMSKGKKRSERLEDDGRTVVLEKEEYEVIGKAKDPK